MTWTTLAFGAIVGAILRDSVVELLRSCLYFFLEFTSFTADGTYAAGWSSNITSVIRRNAEVRTCWMNLGYVEDTSVTADYPHYVECAAALARQLAAAAELHSGDVVVDVGYGYGDQDMLWTRENGVTITGFNVGEEQQRIASRRIAAAGLQDKVDLRVGSATKIPLEAACADKVTSLESAFHYDTREQFFQEAFRVLRPGAPAPFLSYAPASRPREHAACAVRRRQDRGGGHPVRGEGAAVVRRPRLDARAARNALPPAADQTDVARAQGAKHAARATMPDSPARVPAGWWAPAAPSRPSSAAHSPSQPCWHAHPRPTGRAARSHASLRR